MHRRLGERSGNAPAIVMMVVTLNVFSGRPNPEWRLNAKDQAELIHRLTSAPVRLTRAPSPEEPLGYRGFHIRTDGAAGIPGELHVYGGWITGGGQTREDHGRTTERWLLETGLGTIVPDLAKHVAGEISGRGRRP